jgi:hypothetical protein
MGIYRYPKSGALGFIELNTNLAFIATQVGDPFAAAVLFHEAGGHSLDRNILTEGVIEAEILAFQVEYWWLKTIDPSGERLALLRSILTERLRRKPSRLVSLALNFATSLDVLVGTEGDKEKIRKYVFELGYREGHEHDREPLSPSSA